MPLDQPRLDEQLEVAGDARLRLAEDSHEFADGQFGVAEDREQPQPRRLAGSSQPAQHLIHRHLIHDALREDTYKHILMSVKSFILEDDCLWGRADRPSRPGQQVLLAISSDHASFPAFLR